MRVAAIVLFFLANMTQAFGRGPTISSLTPASGPVGTSVAIAGSGFGTTQGTSTLKFNGVTATPTSWSDTSIVAPVPAGATTGSVVVTVGGTASHGVTFTVTPKITGLSPSSGPLGTTITINGTTFGSSQGSSTITFNGTAVTPGSWSDTAIVAASPTPSTAGPEPVVVTVAGHASNSVNYTVLPSIIDINPPAATIGASVTIRGNVFGATQGTSTVTFNGVSAVPTDWQSYAIQAPVPAGTTSGPLIVTVNGTASNSINFTLAPGVAGLNPTSGGPGTPVTISGSAFGSTQGTSTVTFNGVLAVPTSWSNSSIVVPVPAGATTGSVVVTVGGASSSGSQFSVGPTITALSPSSGVAGTVVAVTGANFGLSQKSNSITFGGVGAIPTSWGPSRIVVPVPPGATTGGVVVTIGSLASNSVTFNVGTGSFGGTVSQLGTGSPISGALIEVLQSNVTLASTTAGTDGTYSVPNLNPGVYDLRVSATGFGTAILPAETVTSGATTTVNATLGSSGTISGKITQADGISPLVGAAIVALGGADTAGTGTSDGSGNYSISSLGGGTYVVQVSASGYKTISQPNVSVTAGNNTTQNFSLSGQSLINYDYDELGRLVGVVDSLNGSAAYNYDPVGNLSFISRVPANQTAIIAITPKSGPVGTQVTIYGQAFSATPSQDSVSFNGTSASVGSATATQIMTTVPTGAATGPITVIAPNGSATSTASFTVTAASGAPTITGFTPSIGTVGTAVSISGTNFDVAMSDRLKFNTKVTTVSSATPTTISATVPVQTGSGRITVGTAGGTAVSSGDFFIPPSPYTPSNVAFTSRVNVGDSFTKTFNVAGQVGLVVFDGVANRKISLQYTGGTLQGYTFSINNPDGSVLAPSNIGNCDCGFPLPATGTYTILIVAPSTSTGTINFTLSDSTDFRGTITPDGPPVTITIAAPGQEGWLTFGGVAGQILNVQTTNRTIPCSVGGNDILLLKPDGTTLASSGGCSSGGSIGRVMLPTAGTYTIHLMPPFGSTGSLTLAISTIVDVKGTITAGGAPVTVTTTVPLQEAWLTINAATGQNVTLNVTCSGTCGGWVNLLAPDGTGVTTIAFPAFMDVTALSLPGTYTLQVQPNGPGTETLQLYAPTDVTGSLTIGGPSVTVNITTPGQNARLTFSGATGQQVTLHGTNNSIYSVTVAILNPDGSTLRTIDYNPNITSLDYPTQTLPTTGTYTVLIDPDFAYIGSITLNLTSP